MPGGRKPNLYAVRRERVRRRGHVRISVQIVRNRNQRYNTVGDWKFDATGMLRVKVSAMPQMGWRGEMAVAVHEIVEALLCMHNQVAGAVVDEFDMNYDNMGAECEPGDHPDCPYKHEHAIASSIERLVAEELGINWPKYELELMRLCESYERKTRRPIESEGPSPSIPGSRAASEENHSESQ